MKRIALYTIVIFSLMSFVQQDNFKEEATRNLKNKTFDRGETLKYRVHYGMLNAGEATFNVSPKLYKLDDKVCYRLQVIGETTGAVDLMYNVREDYGTFVDTATMRPTAFWRKVKEGNYEMEEETHFDREKKKAKVETRKKKKKTKHREFEIPSDVHDIVSGYYYLRNIDFNSLNKGDVVGVNAFFENELYDFKIKYLGKGEVKTKAGKFKAIKLVPVMPENDLFDGESSVEIWISDDENKIPLIITSKMFIGKVEVELKDFKGLKHPPAKI